MAERSREVRALSALALPLMAQEAGYQVLLFVDGALLGSYDEVALGGAGIGSTVWFTVMCFGIGCFVGMDTLVSQAVGAAEQTHARQILRAGIRFAIYLCAPCAAVIYGITCLLPAFGVQHDVADAARLYVLGRLPSVLPYLVFLAQRSYLQARGMARPVFVSMVAIVTTNMIAAALLIYGDRALIRIGLPGIGLPALGAFGSGLAITLSSIMPVLVLGAAIRATSRPAPGAHDPKLVRKILRLGAPVGIQLIFELAAYTVLGTIAGRMGAAAAAANQIAMLLVNLIAGALAWGLSTAIGVRVGHHVGAGDAQRAREVGFTGIRVALAMAVTIAAVLACIAGPLASVFSSDVDVRSLAVPLIILVGLCELGECAQIAASAALRGIGDMRFPFVAIITGHYVVGLPLALALCFGAGLGLLGLWIGLGTALAAAAVIMVARFAVLSRQQRARV